jgi:hypothetical protein
MVCRPASRLIAKNGTPRHTLTMITEINARSGSPASFAEIAKREGKVERHIRLLAPLAFVSLYMICRILDGNLPSLAVTRLAKQVHHSWMQQKT